MTRRLVVVWVFLMALGAKPAAALPGELEAVIRFCGAPKQQIKGTSPVTNNLQRTLVYDAVIFHFEPMASGWSFTTGWEGHLPATREQLVREYPCFRDALHEVAITPVKKIAVDPAIAEQTEGVIPFNDHNYGIPHLWMILDLTLILVLCILIPVRRVRLRKKLELEGRAIRRPDVESSRVKAKHIEPDLFE